VRGGTVAPYKACPRPGALEQNLWGGTELEVLAQKPGDGRMPSIGRPRFREAYGLSCLVSPASGRPPGLWLKCPSVAEIPCLSLNSAPADILPTSAIAAEGLNVRTPRNEGEGGLTASSDGDRADPLRVPSARTTWYLIAIVLVASIVVLIISGTLSTGSAVGQQWSAGGIPLFFFVLAFIVAALYSRWSHLRYERALLLSLLGVAVGVEGLFAVLGHTAYACSTAQAIGWQCGSPFQTENALGDLAIAVLAILATHFRDRQFHLAVAILLVVSYIGDGLNHLLILGSPTLYSQVANAWQPGNFGLIYIADFVVPTLVLVLVVREWRRAPSAPVSPG